MSLLAWLTLAYAAVLVVALVASLTTIALYLRRTGALLAEARDALSLLERRTGGLDASLSDLEGATDELSTAFGEAAERMRAVERRLRGTGGTERGKQAG